MNNLIIIGNGFDLAHGMKTSYGDFIKYLVDEHCKDRSKFTDLFSLDHNIIDYNHLISFFKKSGNSITNNYKNGFLRLLLSDFALNHWCDIEYKYFFALTNKLEKGFQQFDPIQLNKEFYQLECYLKLYLSIEERNAQTIDSYSTLFNKMDSNDTTILNFNYTKTIQNHYRQDIKKSRIIHIHGELDNEKNPVVFGYAADNDEARILIEDNNEYMRNIKKHQYKRASNEHTLSQYLDGTKNIDVSIFGHSCGISDKLILNQIFNHPNINSIRIFFFEVYEQYFQTQVNIDRIMNNDERFRKLLINYNDSNRMPQNNDLPDQKNQFSVYVKEMCQLQINAKASMIGVPGIYFPQ